LLNLHIIPQTKTPTNVGLDLTLHLDIKVRDEYSGIFISNSAMAAPIIKWLVKAGWEPDGWFLKTI